MRQQYKQTMSQIDLKDVFLGGDFAISEQQSYQPHRVSIDFPSSHQQNMIQAKYNSKSIFSNHRMSQNPNYKRPNPLNIQHSIRSSYQKSEKVQTEPFSKIQSRLEKITQTQIFQCKYCSLTKQMCPLCAGTKIIRGNNNIVKFFQYVIAFKMGVLPSYSKKKLNSNPNIKNSVNFFCHQFYNNQSDIQSRYSMKSDAKSKGRMSITSKKCRPVDVVNQIKQTMPVHQNYVCDNCATTPIFGYRFHCNVCQDYDLCENCNRYGNHEHFMEKIDKCAKSRQLEKIVNFIQPSSSRMSLRPPPSIKSGLDTSIITVKSTLK